MDHLSNHNWIKVKSFDDVVSQGISAGEDNGNKVYVGRTMSKDGSFIPAKVVPALKLGYYAVDDIEESSEDLEFLNHAENYHWVRFDGVLPENAVSVSGFNIGRALYNGNIVVGRMDIKSKQLVGTYGGKAYNLSTFDVLIYTAKGVVYETIQKASNKSTVTRQTSRQISTKSINSFDRTNENYINLVNKVRTLEMEREVYQKDKQSLEERLLFEQQKVGDLSSYLKNLKIENQRFSKERGSFEEKFSSDERRFDDLQQQIDDYSLNNSFLLKKITTLEEAIQYEKLMVSTISNKLSSSQNYNKTLLTKVEGFEETIKIQQQKIFELESEIMVTASSSETLIKKVAEYEQAIKYLRIQSDTFLKKLENVTTDNEFLTDKLSMLMRTLRAYHAQIDGLNNKLQSSKTVIASAHTELARANSQVAKYQAAISSCYTLNGELMTKIAGLTAVSQNQIIGDYSLNLIDFDFGLKYGYGKTATLLEKTESDSFKTFSKSYEQAIPLTNGLFGPKIGVSYTPFDPENQIYEELNGVTEATAYGTK